MRRRTTTGIPALTIFVAGIIFSWAVSTTCGQTTSESIDHLMVTMANRGQFSGSVLVALHGRMIYENGFGRADSINRIPFTPATPCYLASLSKQFTAMAVMILSDRHDLSYGDLLSKFFPELPDYARRITIRHLLNHTSGIPDYVGLGLEHPGLTNGEVFRALANQDSLNFSPGDRFEYSNSGYILLALIIEKVSGQPYRRFLKDHIFDPLGMKNTFVYDGSAPHAPGRARAYNRFGDEDDYNLLTYGEGGIYSTVEDLFLWDRALYTEKLVKPSTLAEAFAGVKLHDGRVSNYGFGWGIGEFNDETTVSHAGRYGGFNTYIKRFPREQNTIVFLTNHDFKNMSAIGNALINILYNRPYTLPRLSVAEYVYRVYNSEGIAEALGRYHSLRQKNDTTYDFSESELNELGYQLLKAKKTNDAIEILKLNAQEYPASWNVYDGLGEAYMGNGNEELAVHNYRKSLELNPENSNAGVMLKKLLRH